MLSIVPYKDNSVYPVYSSGAVSDGLSSDNKGAGQRGDSSGKTEKYTARDSVVLSRQRMMLADKPPSLNRRLRNQPDKYSPSTDRSLLDETLFSIQEEAAPFMIDSESLKDQYTITMQPSNSMLSSFINKYRQAQAFRYWMTSTMETYA